MGYRCLPARTGYSDNFARVKMGKKRCAHFHRNLILARLGNIGRIKRHAGRFQNKIPVFKIPKAMLAQNKFDIFITLQLLYAFRKLFFRLQISSNNLFGALFSQKSHIAYPSSEKPQTDNGYLFTLEKQLIILIHKGNTSIKHTCSSPLNKTPTSPKRSAKQKKIV